MNGTLDSKNMKEYAFAIGQDAKLLKELGASDTQICNYVTFKGQQIAADKMESYKAQARMGYKSDMSKFNSPIYNAHKANLKWLIENNGAAVRGQ